MADTEDSLLELCPLQCDCFSALPSGVHYVMLKVMTSDSLGALLATSKQFRQLVKGFVTSIMISDGQDAVALNSWPHLRHLDLDCYHNLAELIATLTCGSLFSLQHLDLSRSELSSAAAEQLVSASLPSLTSLSLASTIFDFPLTCHTGPRETLLAVAECQAVCRHVASGRWPNLRALDLGYNSISSHAWSELAKGCWPGLQMLDVRRCFVDDVETSVQHLAAAQWQCLAQLSLSGVHAVLYCLAAANCPQLTVLTIEPYSQGAMIALAHAKSLWQTLRHLTLQDGHCTVVDVLSLVQHPGQALEASVVARIAFDPVQAAPIADSWPGDTRLHVEGSLCPLLMQSLAAGCWPIEALAIEICDFNQEVLAARVRELVCLRLSRMKSFTCRIRCNLEVILSTLCLGITQANWPALQSIHLVSPGVNDSHLMLLTSGNWPMLEALHVSGGQLSLQGPVQLLNSNWPLLKSVTLPVPEAVGPVTSFEWSAQASCQALFARWPWLLLSSSAPLGPRRVRLSQLVV